MCLLSIKTPMLTLKFMFFGGLTLNKLIPMPTPIEEAQLNPLPPSFFLFLKEKERDKFVTVILFVSENHDSSAKGLCCIGCVTSSKPSLRELGFHIQIFVLSTGMKLLTPPC